MVNFSKIEQFLDFMKTFQRNFLIPNICHRSEIFGMCDGLRPEVLCLYCERNNRFFFLWVKMFFLMQNIFIVPAMQHGCCAKPPHS